MKKIYLDFETRSYEDLGEVGAWNYSRHPSTEIVVISLSEGDGQIIGTLDLEVLRRFAVRQDTIFIAHNAFFEQCIYLNILVRQHNFPQLPPTRWMCTMSKCASFSIPSSLEKACIVMELSNQKDKKGSVIMKKLCKPNPRTGEYWESLDETHRQFLDYCNQDVAAMRELDKSLPDLSKFEQAVWEFDQVVNFRGVKVDLDLVVNAIGTYEELYNALTKELVELTNGEVPRITMRDRFKNFLLDKGLYLTDAQKGTIKHHLSDPNVTGICRRMLEIFSDLNSAAIKKYYAFLKHTDPDDWHLRGEYRYCSAGTGRWASQGVQLHSIFKSDMSSLSKILGIPKDDDRLMDQFTSDIKTFTLQGFKNRYGNVIETLSWGLRGCLIPDDGYYFVVSDYATVEVRVLFWLAKEEYGLELLKGKQDIYVTMACKIYGNPNLTKDNNPDERQLGKQSVLGCGFSMSPPKFKITCKKYNIDISDELAEKSVDSYRKTFVNVPKFWYACEGAAKRTITTGRSNSVGHITFFMLGNNLLCNLPSGRNLVYFNASIQEKQIVYWGNDGSHWNMCKTYGGSLVENIVQATARDLEADAMLKLEKSGFQVVMHTHDEPVCQSKNGTEKQMSQILSSVPHWATGCPIESNGWVGTRYRKG